MEIWDLYDENRRKLDITMIRGEEVPRDCYHLAVKICIFNDKGEMLIQKRSEQKREFPLLWDLTACGSAISGEHSEVAIKREVKEELGLDICIESLKLFFTIYDNDWFADVFILKENVDIDKLSFQKEEVKEAKWASKDEILDKIKNGEFMPFKTYEGDMSNFIEMIFEEFKS